jgi:hypothetical protein
VLRGIVAAPLGIKKAKAAKTITITLTATAAVLPNRLNEELNLRLFGKDASEETELILLHKRFDRMKFAKPEVLTIPNTSVCPNF